MTSEDILKIVNLKHAWEFILNKNVILSDTNFSLLCQINKMIEEGFFYSAGKIRSVPVTIGGTNWQPGLPIESIIKEELEEIFNSKMDDIDKAVELLAKNNRMIASFSRALLQDLNAHQTQEEFDAKLNDAIVKIYNASIS